MSKLAKLHQALAALPSGDFAITAPLAEMLPLCTEAGAANWRELAVFLDASITVEPATHLFKISRITPRITP